jgi:CRISPR-associated protein Csb2
MPFIDLSVEFLSGTFHGEDWPPAPSKLYQALLAGARHRYRRGDAWRGEFEVALKWLEEQPAPTVVAPAPFAGTPYRVFGPDNDMDLVVNDWINEARGRPSKKPTDPSRLRCDLQRGPWYVRGAVHYLYGDQGAPIDALEEMIHSVVALGHGIDLAFGRLTLCSEDQAASIEGERWLPSPGTHGLGVGLYVPTKGWYDRLEENYERWSRPPVQGSMDVRKGSVPPSVRPVPYRNSVAPLPRPFLAYRMEAKDDQSPFSVTWESAMEVSARLRHGTSEALRLDGGEESMLKIYALGHGKGKERDHRLSYVPLPSIGHEHSDGRIRRVLLVAPPDDRRIESIAPLMEGLQLVAPGKPPSRLVALDRNDPVLARYVRVSRTWASVTPVILHGHDARRGRVDPERTRALLLEALEQAGIGRAVATFSYGRTSWWPGTGPSRNIRVPEHLAPWPRYHLRVELRTGVKGPLLIGIGRHYGIGLLAAV